MCAVYRSTFILYSSHNGQGTKLYFKLYKNCIILQYTYVLISEAFNSVTKTEAAKAESNTTCGMIRRSSPATNVNTEITKVNYFIKPNYFYKLYKITGKKFK